MSTGVSLGFIGAGKMATALAKGCVQAGCLTRAAIIASDASEGARQSFHREVGAETTASNAEVACAAGTVILAVKPDQVAAVLAELRTVLTPQHLVVSIAAGLRLADLERQLPAGARVIRAMPNTPALVGASASAFACGQSATRADAAFAQRILAAVGLVVEVPEKLLDAVTGLSGSGPAYVYQVIEAMSDGGVAAGLPRDLATRLAAQTVVGAGRMVLETGLHPGVLKDMVTSPGGTTIEGLHELEKAGVRGAFMNAVRAAAERAKKLGQG